MQERLEAFVNLGYNYIMIHDALKTSRRRVGFQVES